MVRHALHRLWRRLTGRPVSVWFHSTYRLPIPQGQIRGMSSHRAQDALTWCLESRILQRAEVQQPAEVAWDDVGLVHHHTLLEQLDDADVLAEILGVDRAVIPVPELLETWRRATAATIEAARWAVRHRGRAINLLGGFHHATPTRGAGLCGINDVAVAVAALRRDGLVGPVLILDLDAHPPDGVVACLGDDPDVSVLSISTESSWEVETDTAATVVDRRIPVGTTSDTYLTEVVALLEQVPPECEVALYIAGGDPLRGDPLGQLDVDLETLRRRDRFVFAALGTTPTVAMPGGGYTDHSWKVLAGTIAEALGWRGSIPTGYDPVFRRSLRVMRQLDDEALTGESTALITEDELLESLGIPPTRRDARFLGFYTRHGLEHAMVAYGYLPALKRLGFRDLKVGIETGRGPHRLMVTTLIDGKREALMDMSVSIRPVEDWRTLFIEWLELRDPRTDFSKRRPQLPGQRGPGLGMADETMQLMGRAADRLGLAGVSFVPSHYHIAWMARGRFVTADPERRGKNRALRRFFDGVPLLEVSRILHGAGLTLRDGTTIHWEPTPMVIARDVDFQEWIASTEEEAHRAEEAYFEHLEGATPASG
ncbi:MAG: histone deacetylase [Myxococcales bacterium]|nr:histone deacetylase [Myxococcales bacterium]